MVGRSRRGGVRREKENMRIIIKNSEMEKDRPTIKAGPSANLFSPASVCLYV